MFDEDGEKPALEKLKTQLVVISELADKISHEKAVSDNRFEALELKYIEVVKKLESGRKYQEELERVRGRLDDSSYVMVLIDGDGMIFKEEFLRKDPATGGTTVAGLIRKEIQEIVSRTSTTTSSSSSNSSSSTSKLTSPSLPSSFEIHIKIFANIGDLSTAYCRAGRIDKSDDFKAFTLGFTQAMTHCYFIDVGEGKEQADSKIKAELSWNLKSENCRMVFLGASHDAGYAPDLRGITSRNQFASKLILLEGTPFVRELHGLRFKKKKLSVFDSRKLLVADQSSKVVLVAAAAAAAAAEVQVGGTTSATAVAGGGSGAVNIDGVCIRRNLGRKGCPKGPKECKFDHRSLTAAEADALRTKFRRAPAPAPP